MIRPLRKWHHRSAVLLGVLLPVAFLVGIAERKPVPVMDSLPKELAAPPQTFEVTEWERADLFAKTPVRVRLLREGSGMGRFAIAFSADADFVKPDLIAYWIPGNPNLTDALPDNALLVGAFNTSVSLPLPVRFASGTGELALYSLADQKLVEVSQPFTFQKP